MRVTHLNTNLLRVGRIRTGCCKLEFNSAYPTSLNGIISENEFRESIANINKKSSATVPRIVCSVIVILCIIGGFTVFILGGKLQNDSFGNLSPSQIFFPLGAALMGVAPIVMLIGCCLINMRRTSRMRKVIAEESQKYSTRSSAACTWRLDVTRIYSGRFNGRRRSVLVYTIIIDIHRTGPPSGGNAKVHSNQVAPRPTSTVRPPSEVPPPPYSSQPAAFCPQCGVQRLGFLTDFCPSCGYSFNQH